MNRAPKYPHYPHLNNLFYARIMRGVLAFYRAGTRSLADRRMVFTFFVQIILDAFQELRQPECVHGSIKPVIKNVRDYYVCIIVILYLFIFFFFGGYLCCAMPTNYYILYYRLN